MSSKSKNSTYHMNQINKTKSHRERNEYESDRHGHERNLTIPNIVPVHSSDKYLLSKLTDCVSLSIIGNTFKLWGNIHYKTNSSTMFKWNLPLQSASFSTLSTHNSNFIFPPTDRRIDFKSVSGIFTRCYYW